MAKIISSGSGPIPRDPSQQRAMEVRKEVLVTPEPKTRKQARANKKAERLTQAQERQAQNVNAPLKVTDGAKRAARKRKREAYRKARGADSRT
jgi:hypothetical protein